MEIRFCPGEELDILHQGLTAFNRLYFRKTGDLSCCVEDEAGQIVAGALAWRADELVMLDLLWVDGSHRGRGLGARILSRLEEEGRRLGCRRLELNTFGFQAPGFYEKQGYRLFGRLEPAVGGYGHYFFVKELMGQ